MNKPIESLPGPISEDETQQQVRCFPILATPSASPSTNGHKQDDSAETGSGPPDTINKPILVKKRSIISPKAMAEYVLPLGQKQKQQQDNHDQNKIKTMMEQWISCPCDEQCELSTSFETLMHVHHFDNFESLYVIRRPLRSGSYGSVCEVEHRLSGQFFAVKISDRTTLKKKDSENVYREVKVLRKLRQNKGTITLVDFFESPTKFHIVLELAKGGDLFDRLTKRDNYTEREARLLARRLLEIIQYIHLKGIVHRDLKAENVLLMIDDDTSSIKLADFGFAAFCPTGTVKYKEAQLAKLRREERQARRKYVYVRQNESYTGSVNGSSPNCSRESTQHRAGSPMTVNSSPVSTAHHPTNNQGGESFKQIPEGFLTTRCGTPSYVAPEILIGAPYNHMVDNWSYGVMLYILLGGCFPFQASNRKLLYRKIRAADFAFDPDHWSHVSVEAKTLVTSFLRPDPNSRRDAATALKDDPWLSLTGENMSEARLAKSDLSRTLRRLRTFNAKRTLKSATHAITWARTAGFFAMDNVAFTRDSVAQNQKKAALSSSPPQPAKIVQDDVILPQTASQTSASSTSTTDKIQFSDVYSLQRKLRSGAFATVWEGCLRNAIDSDERNKSPINSNSDQSKDTVLSKASKRVANRKDCQLERYAIKVCNRTSPPSSKQDASIMNEVAIVQSLKSDYIISLYDFFEEPTKFYIVMEYMSGGDVFDRIVKRRHYTELDARNLARKLLQAIEYIHERSVAHRDLKPQNLLLFGFDDDSNMKVADFGFAKRVHTPNCLTTRCGTPTYVAPEILKNHPYGRLADMWSVGIVLHVLLVGYPPFMEQDQKTLFHKIRLGSFVFHEEDWTGIAPSAKDLILGLLQVDPLKRLKAKHALRSRWIRDVNDKALSSTDLSSSAREMARNEAQIKLDAAVTAQRIAATIEEEEHPFQIVHTVLDNTVPTNVVLAEAVQP